MGVTLTPLSLDGFSASMKSKQRDSLAHGGVVLYNVLPSSIRSITQFKCQLDTLLSILPDQPAVPELVPQAKDIYGHPSNSNVD